MRSMTRFVPILLTAALAAGCGKGPAQQALDTANAALAAAQPQVEKYVPEVWRSLSETAAAAKAQIEQGKTEEALAAARGLIPKIEAAVAAAAARKEDLTSRFQVMKDNLPGAFDALGQQLEAYAAMPKLPAGIEQAAVEAARAALPGLRQAWAQAVAAFDSGDVVKAAESGMAVKSKVDEMALAFVPNATVTPVANY